MREPRQSRACDRARPRPAKAISSLAQAAHLRKRLAPTGPPPHHQATPPCASRPSPTEALHHRHRHGPASPAPAKPWPSPHETYTAKQGQSLPRPRLREIRIQTTTGKPDACSLGPANLASLFNVLCPSLQPLLNLLRLGPLRPYPRDSGRISSHHFTTARGLGRATAPLPFTPLGLTPAYPAPVRHKNTLWTERNRLLPPTAGLCFAAGVIKRISSVKSRIYAA